MDPLVGQTIGGRYTLHRLVGKGAMGRVYLATDQRLHGRECAVKVLTAHTDEDDDERSRFERELRIVSLLRGPNVVQVLDSGALADGRPYIVMELLVGQPLHAVMRQRGPLPASEVIAIAVDVLHGLAEAHAYGVVHRDLKPANVFLCPTADDMVRAKVLDFGVAKQLRGDDADITRTKASVGTPRYMAPEQFVQGTLSARTDLYGVGALIYVMLTGQPPFSGDEEMPEALAALPRSSRLAWLHLHRAPPVVGGVSAAFAALVARLMAKRPSDRPPSARAVIELLRALPEAAAGGEAGAGVAVASGAGATGGMAIGVRTRSGVAGRAGGGGGAGGGAGGGGAGGGGDADGALRFDVGGGGDRLVADAPDADRASFDGASLGGAGLSGDDDSAARTMGEAGTRRSGDARRRRMWIPAVAVVAAALAVLAAIGLGGRPERGEAGGDAMRPAAAIADGGRAAAASGRGAMDGRTADGDAAADGTRDGGMADDGSVGGAAVGGAAVGGMAAGGAAADGTAAGGTAAGGIADGGTRAPADASRPEARPVHRPAPANAAPVPTPALSPQRPAAAMGDKAPATLAPATLAPATLAPATQSPATMPPPSPPAPPATVVPAKPSDQPGDDPILMF